MDREIFRFFSSSVYFSAGKNLRQQVPAEAFLRGRQRRVVAGRAQRRQFGLGRVEPDFFLHEARGPRVFQRVSFQSQFLVGQARFAPRRHHEGIDDLFAFAVERLRVQVRADGFLQARVPAERFRVAVAQFQQGQFGRLEGIAPFRRLQLPEVGGVLFAVVARLRQGQAAAQNHGNGGRDRRFLVFLDPRRRAFAERGGILLVSGIHRPILPHRAPPGKNPRLRKVPTAGKRYRASWGGSAWAGSGTSIFSAQAV